MTRGLEPQEPQVSQGLRQSMPAKPIGRGATLPEHGFARAGARLGSVRTGGLLVSLSGDPIDVSLAGTFFRFLIGQRRIFG